MQQQAAVRIDRKIGGTNAEMPEPVEVKVCDEPSRENATEAVFEPYKGKIRKSGTGLRDDDKRPPLRGTVHTESERQTHIQERIRQDTRGMRRKARRTDKNDESRNR